MIMIDHAMGWFKIFKIPTYYLNKVTGGNDECIYTSSLRVIQLFKKNGLSDTRHAKPCFTSDLILNKTSYLW